MGLPLPPRGTSGAPRPRIGPRTFCRAFSTLVLLAAAAAPGAAAAAGANDSSAAAGGSGAPQPSAEAAAADRLELGGRGGDDWRSRVIYQVITDRFASNLCEIDRTCELDDWCGGNLNGVASMAPYIQDLGADAVWLSPFTRQGGPFYGVTGYHGYWPSDFYDVDPHFGTREELQRVMSDLHARGMLVMQDVVLNHVGYGDWATYRPFNKLEDFHDCNSCFTMSCQYALNTSELFYDYYPRQHCQLSGLPDLNQSDPSVAKRLKEWVTWLRSEFRPDALRLDAAAHQDMDFLKQLRAANPGIFLVGEWFIESNTSWLGHAMKVGAASSLYNFDIYNGLLAAFGAKKGMAPNMTALREARTAVAANFPPDVIPLLVNFIDNHDTPRFAGSQTDLSQYMNAIAYVLLAEGIPSIYQGTEAGFTGGGPPFSPDRREPLWWGSYNIDSPRYEIIWKLIRYRKAARVWEAGPAEEVYADNSTLVLARGPFVLVLDNRGSASPAPKAPVELKGLPARFAGRELLDILHDDARLAVDANGSAVLNLHPSAEPRVFYDGALMDDVFAGLWAAGEASRRTSRAKTAMDVLLPAFAGLVPAVMVLTLLLMTLHARAADARAAAAGAEEAGGKGGAAAGPAAAPMTWLTRLRMSPKGAKRASKGSKGGAAPPDVGGGAVVLDLRAPPDGRAPSAAASSARAPSKLGRRRSAGSLTLDSQLSSPLHRGGSATAPLLTTGLLTLRSLNGPLGGPSFSDGGRGGAAAHEAAGGGAGGGAAAGGPEGRGGPPLVGALVAAADEVSRSVPTTVIEDADADDGPLRAPSAPVPLAGLRRSGSAGAYDSGSLLPPIQRGPSAVGGWARPAPGALLLPPGPGATAPGRSVSSRNGSVAAGAAKAAEAADAAEAAEAAGSRSARASPTGGSASSAGLLKRLLRAAVRATSSSSPADGAPARPGFVPGETPVLHVALEYALPHLGLNSELMFGGLGMVVATFMDHWPGPVSLIAPLYKPCYDVPGPPAGAANGAGAGAEGAPAPAPAGGRAATPGPGGCCPAWLGEEQLLLSFTVDASPAGGRQRVEVFKTVVGSRTYYLVQADIFRDRTRGTMYSFEDEAEMLTWMAVFNQAVAAVIVEEGITHMQLHDYHGGASLLYVPPERQPAVLYVGHNAHYNLCTPIPTTARRNYVYNTLGLNAEQAARFAEHKGSFDFLRGVVTHLLRRQAGIGVVAVSPRYAQQMATKLSVFWPLAPAPGAPPRITGVLNSIDMKDSLALQLEAGMSLQEALAAKRDAKLKLQAQFGLAVGAEYDVAVFIGRLAAQKGCDIIAEAAPFFMARHPRLQLLHLGPLGDPVGTAAQARLADLAEAYPGRMVCPREGHYVTGAEKKLLMDAADFCLIPSRFEPCGLVDVEMGWNGAICIGHDTGGLGKMPGVYFKAQATHLSHLAAHLGAAVGRACALTGPQREAMVADALARRFPAQDMMAGYTAAWQKIDAAFQATEASRTAKRRRQDERDHHAFFARKWERANKAADAAAARSAPGSKTATGASLSGGSGWGDGGGGGGGPWLTGLVTEYRPEWGDASNKLLSILQYFGLMPGVLLLAMVLVLRALADKFDACVPYGYREIHRPAPGMELRFPEATWTVVLLLSGLSALCTPVWFALSFRLSPRTYIRFACAAVLAGFLMLLAAVYLSNLVIPAAGVIGALMLAPAPLLSMGFLGQEDSVEVSSAGRLLMALAEAARATVCLAAALLVALWEPLGNSLVPLMAVGGAGALVAAAFFAYFLHPGTLNPAFDHQRLVLSFETLALVKRLGCFWLSLAVAGADATALAVYATLVLAARGAMEFAALQAAQYGGTILAVTWAFLLLRSRLGELRLNGLVMALAALPFYYLIKGAVAVYAPSLGAALAASLAADLVFSARSGVAGLAGFVTLPCREIVAVWQLGSIFIGTACLAAVGAVYSAYAAELKATQGWAAPLGALAAVEGVRVAAAAGMAAMYGRENLASP